MVDTSSLFHITCFLTMQHPACFWRRISKTFLRSLAAERDLSLFLRPSIDLLFEEAWLKDRNAFWTLLRSLSSHERVPAIAKIIGPAVIPELAKLDDDLSPMIVMLISGDLKEVALAEQWIVHVVGAVLAGDLEVAASPVVVFCLPFGPVKGIVHMAAVCQSLVDYIIEREAAGEENTREGLMALSHVAVLLLDRFMQMEPRDSRIVARTICNVMDLFWINPEESATAIRKVITPDEVRNRGAERGIGLRARFQFLFRIDPELAADIYTAFFGYEEKSRNKRRWVVAGSWHSLPIAAGLPGIHVGSSPKTFPLPSRGTSTVVQSLWTPWSTRTLH